MFKSVIYLVFLINYCHGQQFYLGDNHFTDLNEVFSWKQVSYDMDGVLYIKDSIYDRKPGIIVFQEENLTDKEKYFIQLNNVPVGFEVYKDRAFITVPRRRYGIPSTLNYVYLNDSSPLFKPYPNTSTMNTLVSVYRPRVDDCGRLWVVDTGNLEIPNERVQKKPPQIIVFDLKSDKEVLRYDIPTDVIADAGKSTYGLNSITVDVTSSTCDDAYAYITDLLGNGLIVFSLKQLSFWRFSHPSFIHDVGATGFKVRLPNAVWRSGLWIDSSDVNAPSRRVTEVETLNWTDGLFSIALSDADSTGRRTAYYHPLVSNQEFSVDTNTLKNRSADFKNNYKLEGVRGAWSQSGSHAFHSGTKTLLYANVAQDAIMCWNTNKPLLSNISATIANDHTKLVYISDLKVIGDDVWVLSNRLPSFIYGSPDPSDTNFYIFRGKVEDLIKGSACDDKM